MGEGEGEGEGEGAGSILSWIGYGKMKRRIYYKKLCWAFLYPNNTKKRIGNDNQSGQKFGLFV